MRTLAITAAAGVALTLAAPAVADVGDGAPARVDLREPGLALQGVVDDLALHVFQRTWSAGATPLYGPGRRVRPDAVVSVTSARRAPSATQPIAPMWTPNISVRYISDHIGARCCAELFDRRVPSTCSD